MNRVAENGVSRLREQSAYTYNIRWTEDPDMFSCERGNRSLDGKHVDRLAEAIERSGFISPIFVSPAFTVIDGQHRLAASKRLKRAVPYMVVPEATIDTVIELNSNSKQWSIAEYIESYATRGIDAYVRVFALSTRTGIPTGTLVRLVNQGYKRCREGLLNFTEEDAAHVLKVVALRERLYQWVPREKLDKSSMVIALAQVMAHSKFDEALFVKNFELLSQRFPHCGAIGDARRALAHVMNYGRHKQNHIE